VVPDSKITLPLLALIGPPTLTEDAFKVTSPFEEQIRPETIEPEPIVMDVLEITLPVIVLFGATDTVSPYTLPLIVLPEGMAICALLPE